jgi:hypothetical protein
VCVVFPLGAKRPVHVLSGCVCTCIGSGFFGTTTTTTERCSFWSARKKDNNNNNDKKEMKSSRGSQFGLVLDCVCLFGLFVCLFVGWLVCCFFFVPLFFHLKTGE